MPAAFLLPYPLPGMCAIFGKDGVYLCPVSSRYLPDTEPIPNRHVKRHLFRNAGLWPFLQIVRYQCLRLDIFIYLCNVFTAFAAACQVCAVESRDRY
jgi:hypothetical protein